MTSRITATYRDTHGNPLRGWWEIKLSDRLSNLSDDEIYPAGRIASGHLGMAPDALSMDVTVPSTDDPRIAQHGWHLVVRTRFACARDDEEYHITEIPTGVTLDLSDFVPVDIDDPLGSGVIIEGPPGPTGATIDRVSMEGTTLTLTMTDGRVFDIELPDAGEGGGGPGTPGRGIESITAEGDQATITYTDGGFDVITLPTGPAGADGTQTFTGHGPPPDFLAGAKPGDIYIDVFAGNTYTLNPGA